MTATPERSATMDDSREAWDAIASGYDEFVTSTHFPIGNEALERAGLAPGMTFLDVAAGSGALSMPAARHGATVTATDISPAMVERLTARAQAEGLSSLEATVMDGHALEFPDDCFDVAGSQFGVMLFPDLPRALAELARVTRPGGKVVLVVYGPPAQIDFLSMFIEAMQTVVPGFAGLPTDPPPLEFQVAHPDRLRERLAGASLSGIDVETVTERLVFASGSQLWDWVTNSNPIGARLVEDLSPDQAESVRAALDDQIRMRAGNGELAELNNTVHIGIGTVA